MNDSLMELARKQISKGEQMEIETIRKNYNNGFYDAIQPVMEEITKEKDINIEDLEEDIKERINSAVLGEEM